MLTFLELPQDVLLDSLLPTLPVSDVFSLCLTCRSLSRVIEAEVFWRRRCQEDFNFDTTRLPCLTGWKDVYRALTKPEVFVWGDARNGRMEVKDDPILQDGGVPYPVRIPMPMKSIVDIQGAGWCYYVLDSKGQVYVWGTMDPEVEDDNHGPWNKTFTAHSPTRLALPIPIHKLSCGRKHVMALDSTGHIWVFVSWGRPFRLVTPLLDNSSPERTIAQIECGFSYCSVLTESGDVYAFSPFFGRMAASYDEQMRVMDNEVKIISEEPSDNSIPCNTWDLLFDPDCLYRPPSNLPGLWNDKRLEEDENNGPIIIRIAALMSGIVAVTNQGHVLKYDLFHRRTDIRAFGWEYLPEYSEYDKIEQYSNDLPITHVTANRDCFAAYSVSSEIFSSILIGDGLTNATSRARVMQNLHHTQFTSISMGDFHQALLSVDGKVYTCGRNLSGALGLWNNPDERGDQAKSKVDRPTQVIFDPVKTPYEQPYCVQVLAAGWQSAALVLDLKHELCEHESRQIVWHDLAEL